ncbi:hypothetical protein LINGRAPRIM_LOCUS2895, partial [Linum grandiflorum]
MRTNVSSFERMSTRGAGVRHACAVVAPNARMQPNARPNVIPLSRRSSHPTEVPGQKK